MKSLGLILIVVGVLSLAVALQMDTTVHLPGQTIVAGEYSASVPPQWVHNLGLMVQQLEWVVISGLTALSGVLFYGFGQVVEQRKETAAIPASSAVGDEEDGFARRGDQQPPRKQRGLASFLASE